jgi:hypothetical protein
VRATQFYCSFDAEVTQFLRVCLELEDIRNELPSYSAVWAVMKVGLLPPLLQLRHGAYDKTRRWSRYLRTHPVQGVYSGHTKLSRRCWIMLVYGLSITNLGVSYMQIFFEYRTPEPFSISAKFLGTECVR